MQICPSCGTENPERARFCMACGSALVGTGSGEERRFVTVLFADIAGFSARFDRADPEDISAALRPFHARLKQEIESFGGTVDKFAGDVVFGVFGAPVAHEDDPERAIRASLKIRDWVHAQSEGEAARSLGTRIGIASGEAMVAVGQGPRVGERVTGDIVNTASRLQSTAAPDSIVVGESTYLATETQFRWTALPPVTVKGKAEPIRVWAPIEPFARVGVEPPDPAGAPFIGRLDELAALRSQFELVLRTGSTHGVSIIGEAGVGKSRLIAELSRITDELPDMIRWRVGRPAPYGDTSTFAALADVVRSEAGILTSDAPEAAEERVHAVLGRMIEDPDERGRLAPHLIALVAGEVSEGDTSRDEAFAAWGRFLDRLGAENPTIIVFEDMHAASEPSLAFVESLLDAERASALLIVVAARPELFDLRPGWGRRSRWVTIVVEPLDAELTGTLVRSLPLDRPLDPGLARIVVERAGGNPLYAEEFVRMLNERGDADDLDGEIAVPPTIQGLLASRLDAMPAELKGAARDAAVVGMVVWPGALAAVTGRTEAEAMRDLETLADRQVVRRATASAVEGQAEFVFRHVLVREVAYGSIPRGERARKHLAVASWLEATLDPRAADRAERLAIHYAEAHTLATAAGEQALASQVAGPAVEQLLSAATRTARLDAPSALSQYRRALSLMEPDHPDRARALRGAGVSAQSVGAFADAQADLTEAMELFAAAGDVADAADVKVLLARSAFERGEIDAVAPLLTQAVRELETLPPGPEFAHAATRVAGHLWVVGDYPRCIRWSDRALELARDLNLPREQVLALQYRGASRSKMGDTEGLADLEEALRTGRDRGLGEETSIAYNNYAYELWFHRGSWASIEAWEEMEAFCRDRGLETSLAWARSGIVEPLFDVGAWDRVLSISAELRTWDVDHGGWTIPGAVALSFQGWVSLRRGELEVASGCAEALTTHAGHLGTAEYLTPALMLRGEVAAARGEDDTVRQALESFLVASEDQPTFRLGAAPLLTRLLVGVGEVERAATFVTEDLDEVATNERLSLSLMTSRAVVREAEERWDEALTLYEDVARRWDRYGFPVETARCGLGAGRVHAALGHTVEATGWFRDARSTFEALGAKPWLDEVDRAERDAGA
ncbi:MAG: adenylate/guanylate cyclase domain-containing protein [Actinomycetota bacterium]